ncbi:MAG: LysR family transcriptional regulator, partial [Alphaproteobacteria bacterium]
EHAAKAVLWPAVNRVVSEYPDIKVELSIESGFTDIVEQRFDAGVRLGERVEKDMIAVRIGPELRMAAVGSPSYFAERGVPLTPQDLTQHSCINLRLNPTGGLYAWEFEKEGREVRVRVEGQLAFNQGSLILDAAAAGHGIAYALEDRATEYLSDGRLVRILEDWCEPFAGYHLYYPSRRHVSPALALLVEALRHRHEA